MAKKTKAPARPKRGADTQVFIRTTKEVVDALQAYADQEDRSLSKAGERLLIDALRERRLLADPAMAAPAAEEERVRGGADIEHV